MKWADIKHGFQQYVSLVSLGVYRKLVLVTKKVCAQIGNIPSGSFCFLKKAPWGTIIFVLIIIGGLYALYPSDGVADGKTPSAVTALFYAVGVVVGLGVLVLGWFLFRPKWKEKKEKPEVAEQKKSSLPQKAPKGDIYAAEKVVGAMVLLAGFFFFCGAIPYDTVPPVAADGMLYIPMWGLVRASVIMLFISLMWSFFVETNTTNGAIFAIVLILGGLVISFLSIKGYWFAPLATDPLVPISGVLVGVAVTIGVVYALTKNIEYVTIVLLGAIAVWLPQLAAKSPALIEWVRPLFL